MWTQHPQRVSQRILQRVLAQREPRQQSVPGYQEAAVLVPLFEREGRPHLLFIVRPHHMPTHPGQVAFPGGRRSPGDPDLVTTALRETEEELGVDPRSVEVLGRLDDVLTPVGYVITPVVGWWQADAQLRPDPREVAAWFQVPLDQLCHPSCCSYKGVRTVGGWQQVLHEYRVEENLIWGATARMVTELLCHLGLDPDRQRQTQGQVPQGEGGVEVPGELRDRVS